MFIFTNITVFSLQKKEVVEEEEEAAVKKMLAFLVSEKRQRTIWGKYYIYRD